MKPKDITYYRSLDLANVGQRIRELGVAGRNSEFVRRRGDCFAFEIKRPGTHDGRFGECYRPTRPDYVDLGRRSL